MKMVLLTLRAYALSALPYIVVLVPLLITARALWLKVGQRRVRLWRELGLGLLYLYIVGNSLEHYGGAALYVSLLGNVCLFIPLGFLSVLCFKGVWWKCLIAGAAFSIGIELYQLFLPRAVDIDDVICNTAGMMIGYYVGRICLLIAERRRRKTA